MVYGIGAVTNLSDQFTWGLWISFDVMSGVALAAGAFVIAATVHILAGSIVTAPLGARPAPRLPVTTLKRVFALLLLALATRMVLAYL